MTFFFCLLLRNIPLAILIAMPTVTVVYLLVNISYFTVMSIEELKDSPAVGIVSQILNPKIQENP